MITKLESARAARRLPLMALAATVVLLISCTTASTGVPVEPTPAQAGRELAQRECASCHAIGELGRSVGGALGEEEPSDAPPPLRDVLDRYSPNRLKMAFQEGMIVGHAEMPIYRLSDEETDELLAYLQSIKD